MIVYVETNFVLELALLQDEHRSCDAIIGLAGHGKIELVIPAFSIAEPYETLVRRSRRRNQLYQALTREMDELSRSVPHADTVENLRELAPILRRSGDEDIRRLNATLIGILEPALAIPMESVILEAAIEFQTSLGLSPQDAIVYSSIVNHLSSAPAGPKCFLNKNSRDFVNPRIVERLAADGCRLITGFSDGLGYINSQLG